MIDQRTGVRVQLIAHSKLDYIILGRLLSKNAVKTVLNDIAVNMVMESSSPTEIINLLSDLALIVTQVEAGIKLVQTGKPFNEIEAMMKTTGAAQEKPPE